MKIDIDWFKNEFIPLMGEGYKLKYSSFKNGDFGDLDRIEFDGEGSGGNVDFWSSGWLSIHFVDYVIGEELLNVLLEPQEIKEKGKAFKKLKQLLK